LRLPRDSGEPSGSGLTSASPHVSHYGTRDSLPMSHARIT
jgi:hypothetical protein